MFINFRKDRTNFQRRFIQGTKDVEQGFSRMVVSCLKIITTNAMLSKSFSKANCATDPKGGPVAFGSLFHSGIEVLKRYRESAANLPTDSLQRMALKNLIVYFSEGEPPEEFFHASEAFTDLEWTVLVAQHVLSGLAGKTYTVDHHYPGKYILASEQGDDDVCPCSRHEEIMGVFDDTSFGCEEGWHGSVDILIGVPVMVKTYAGSLEVEDRLSALSDCSETSDELQESSAFSDDELEQLLSECICYSFLQKRYDSSVSLVPAIGISKRKLIINFYDSENDILLTTADLDLEDEENPGELHPGVIIMLWLTLNYKIFCTGVPEPMLSHRAGFGAFIGDKLEVYRNAVKQNVPVVTCAQDRYAFADQKGAVL